MIRWDTRNSRWRWEFDRIIEGERVRKSKLLVPGCSEEQAQALAAKFEAEEFVKRRLVASVLGWEDYVDQQLSRRGSWLHNTLAGCKSRSTAKGRVLNMTPEQLAAVMRRSRGRCEVTGIQFQVHKPDDARARPFMHSIDRIDSTRGYVDGNCRLVCYAVNLAMSNWGEDVFAQIATGYIVNRYCALGLTQQTLREEPVSAKRHRTLPEPDSKKASG